MNCFINSVVCYNIINEASNCHKEIPIAENGSLEIAIHSVIATGRPTDC